MITARGLARTFTSRRRTVNAVQGVDLDVARGEIVGFLGPNGAGKTTTLRMLTTLLNPTAGTATVAGCDLRRDPAEVRKRIGYVAQGGGTNPADTVEDELSMQAKLYRLDNRTTRERVAALYEQLELAGLGQRFIKTLSGGQRRRLDIALGLIHQPPLVFLDEPTTGLDPQSRSNLWEHIRKIRDELGTTVFLTTHYLDEADALCDRILVIDHGIIVATGTPDELKARISGDVVTIELPEAPIESIPERVEKATAALNGHASVREINVEGRVLRLTVEHGDQVLLSVIRTLDSAAIDLASIQLSRPTLDDVFLALTGRSLRENAAA